MKQMIAVRSNAYYVQEENKNSFELKPMLELVIIHTNKKDYKFVKEELVGTNKLAEQRLIISPALLEMLITELQLHQKKLNGIRNNADKLNALVNHISNITEEEDAP